MRLHLQRATKRLFAEPVIFRYTKSSKRIRSLFIVCLQLGHWFCNWEKVLEKVQNRFLLPLWTWLTYSRTVACLVGGTFAAPVCYATNSTSVSVDVLSPFQSARQVHTFGFCFFAVPNIGACRSIRTVHLHNRLIVHRYLFHHFCFGCENV